MRSLGTVWNTVEAVASHLLGDWDRWFAKDGLPLACHSRMNWIAITVWICLIFLKFQRASLTCLVRYLTVRHSLIYLFLFGVHKLSFSAISYESHLMQFFIILWWLFIKVQGTLFKYLLISKLLSPYGTFGRQWDEWGCKRPGYRGQLQDHLLV